MATTVSDIMSAIPGGRKRRGQETTTWPMWAPLNKCPLSFTQQLFLVSHWLIWVARKDGNCSFQTVAWLKIRPLVGKVERENGFLGGQHWDGKVREIFFPQKTSRIKYLSLKNTWVWE